MKEYRIAQTITGYYQIEYKREHREDISPWYVWTPEWEITPYWYKKESLYISLSSAMEALERMESPNFHYPPDFEETKDAMEEKYESIDKV